MAQFIVNPRRAPRVPARCRAAVVSSAGAFDSETEDIGSRGCQVVSPRLVRQGEAVRLTVSSDGIPEPLRVAGKVAWVSPQAPWRVGIAFDEGSSKESARWFDLLLATHPGLGAVRRVPERIPVEAMVYLGPPPRFLLDFSADEAMLLRAVGSGARVDELQARLRDDWPAAQRALFSLIARQVVTLSRGQAAHPEAWKKVLTEIEASIAVDSLGNTPPAIPVAPRARPAPAPTPTPLHPAATPVSAPPPASPVPAAPLAASPGASSLSVELEDLLPPDPGPAPGPRGAARLPDVGVPWSGASSEASPDFTGAGVGWRGSSRARSPEAQEVFDRAVMEIERGGVNGAIALLRRALSLAPGDPEIAEALGRLAFHGRSPKEG